MVAHRLKRPTRGHRTGRPRASPYLALLRVGFAEPARSPGPLVRSYRTVSPLPRLSEAVCFLWHFPEGRPRWTLSTTLPFGARTFLPQTMLRAAARPAPANASFVFPPLYQSYEAVPASMARLAAASAAAFRARGAWRTATEPNARAASFARS